MKLPFFVKNDEKRIALLFVSFFSYNLITLFVNILVSFVWPGTPLDTAMCMAVYALFIISAIEPICKRISIVGILFPFFVFLLYVLHGIVFPSNEEELVGYMPEFLFTVLPLFLLGGAIRDYKVIVEYFEKASRYVICIAFTYYMIIQIAGLEITEDNMSFAYYLLPFSVMNVYSLVHKFSLGNLLRMALALYVHLLAGTRGPLLCIAVSMVLFVYFNKIKSKTKLVWTVILIGFVIFLSSDLSIELLQNLHKFFQKNGINSRILEKFLDQTLMEDSGRAAIRETLIIAVHQRPLVGYGLMGDRVILSGSYAHSLIYELMIDFGIVGGLALLAILVALLTKDLLGNRISKHHKIILVCLCSCVFVKLFFSSSYLREPSFFLLLGMLFQRKKTEASSNEQNRIN